MRLIAALGDVSRRKLWTGFLISLAVNVAIAVYTVLYLPIIRLQPTCWNEDTFSLFAPDVEVDGELAGPFFSRYHTMVSGLRHAVYGKRIYVPISVWLDRDWIMNMSNRATLRLLADRTGASEWDIMDQKIGLPEFDEVSSHEWPPCEGMRKLAIKGGEWEWVGPKPDITEVLKRRAQRRAQGKLL